MQDARWCYVLMDYVAAERLICWSAVRLLKTKSCVDHSTDKRRVHKYYRLYHASRASDAGWGVTTAKLLVHMSPKSNMQSLRRTMACSRLIE